MVPSSDTATNGYPHAGEMAPDPEVSELPEYVPEPIPEADIAAMAAAGDLQFQLPDPEDDTVSEGEFQQRVGQAWQVCDRFDLQTDIWRGRILKTVRDREKAQGEGRGSGFLNWLAEREISKSQAYQLIELADSADILLQEGMLEPEDVNRFSKKAFVATAQASPEVQQLVSDAAHQGDRITRREVRQLSDDWTAMSSDLLPPEVKEKTADNTIPTKYVAPLVRELEKLPENHQLAIKNEVAAEPSIDGVKQATAEAKYLAKYLQAATEVQALNHEDLDLELALEEALRIGCLNSTAELVNQASQLEKAIAKVYTSWKRLNKLAERVYLDSGASTPNVRSLLDALDPIAGDVLQIQLGEPNSELSKTIRIQILPEE
ncbi:MAG: hypothetical protein VKJ64_01515 [Leptolyngbyaceae bacterium]|nr:hypothetical protein [Leptolyngbyaceae bacterium]